jgi:hypothetical protein
MAGRSTECVVAKPGVDGPDAAMERYSKGDEVAFAELYDAIAPRLLYAKLRGMTSLRRT